MHSQSALGRLIAAVIVLATVQLTASAALAGTCGVLPFTHGADVTEGAATNITSLVSTELDFRGGWTIVVTASKQEITDGCGTDTACIMAFGKGETHDGVVTGTIATEGADKYRITSRWYEVSTGRLTREVSQAIARSADLLIEEVPGLVTELLTGKKPVAPDSAEDKTETFASLDEIDFDDLDEEEEEEPRVRQKAKPKRDNRGRRREPVEEADDPFGLDEDDLDDVDETNDRERRESVERAEREEKDRRARSEERRRAERIAEERRAEEEKEEAAREDRRERERLARQAAEREQEEEDRQARADERRRERQVEDRRRREARDREEAEANRLAEAEAEQEADEARERRSRERREREEEKRLAERRSDRRAKDSKREAKEEESARSERLAENRRRDREQVNGKDEAADYGSVELGSALAAGAISFDGEGDDEGYVGFVTEDEEEDEEPLMSMQDADDDEDPVVGDLVTDGGYDDPGARRRAAAAGRKAQREDRYSRARNFGSSSDEDEDEDEGYTSLDSDDEDDRSSRGSRSSDNRAREQDNDRDGTYRYRPSGADDDDLDREPESGSYASSKGTSSRARTDPTARRHISIRGSGGVSAYYLWFGQYGIDLGIFPVDQLSIDVGAEGWSLSLTEQDVDDSGDPMWDENGLAITSTELRTLPHLTVGASWRGNFHRVIKPYAGGDVGALMYATEVPADGGSIPRFGVTGMAKVGSDFMFTKFLGAHIGVRVGVAYSPKVEELVFFEWNPVTFVFNFKGGLTLTF